jgi:hypothetical protein
LLEYNKKAKKRGGNFMVKRSIVSMFAMGLILAAGVCGNVQNSSTANAAKAKKADYMIGIMTSTVSQGEEPYRAAQKLKKAYPGHVVVVTFPDNFASEQETTISTALSLAANPKIKAIVFSQSLLGTAAAAQKIREVRPDILIVCGSFNESPATLSAVSDVFYRENIPKMGYQVVRQALDAGVKTIVHYSFPRHLAFQPMAQRLQNIKIEAAKHGIKVVEVTTPDPTSDAGTAGTQQFVLEDVPRQVQKYGKNTLFFGTNTAQLEPMCKQAAATKSYYYPSVQSVYTGFAAALGLAIPKRNAFNKEYYEKAITNKLAKMGCAGHMGCWMVPIETLQIEGGFYYAQAYCQGKTKGAKFDLKVYKASMNKAAGAALDYENVIDGKKSFKNGFYIMEPYKLF